MQIIQTCADMFSLYVTKIEHTDYYTKPEIVINLSVVASPLQNDLEAVRKSFDIFFLRYPYCYGYWKKYADIEKKHENIQIAEEVNINIFWTHICSFLVFSFLPFAVCDAVFPLSFFQQRGGRGG